MTVFSALPDTFYRVTPHPGPGASGVLVCAECLDSHPDDFAGMGTVMVRPVGEACSVCGQVIEALCPAGGTHRWGWHTEDGAGRPITPGVFCDECAEQHPDDDQFPTRRHWETAGV